MERAGGGIALRGACAGKRAPEPPGGAGPERPVARETPRPFRSGVAVRAAGWAEGPRPSRGCSGLRHRLPGGGRRKCGSPAAGRGGGTGAGASWRAGRRADGSSRGRRGGSLQTGSRGRDRRGEGPRLEGEGLLRAARPGLRRLEDGRTGGRAARGASARGETAWGPQTGPTAKEGGD